MTPALATVSVVMGAFNAAQFIVESLEAIGAQTAAPLEVIVVDDSSTDGTAELASNWGAIVVPSGGRAGVAGARNVGLAHATGEFVAICDADDLWHPTKLERQLEALARAPDVDFAFCDYYDFTSEGIVNASVFKATHRHVAQIERAPLGRDAYRCPRASLNAATLEHTFALPSTFVVRRRLVEALGGFDVDAPPQEDAEFLMRLFTRSDGVYVDAPLMGYRSHASNVTRDARGLRYGMVKQADRVLAHPERYPPGSAEHFRRVYPELLFKAGRMFAVYGDTARARDMLGRSFAERRAPKALLWLGLIPFLRARLAREFAQKLRAAGVRRRQALRP